MVVNELSDKPSQLKFVRVAQMLLFSNALCDPPLGQTTIVKSDQDSVGLSLSYPNVFSIVSTDKIYSLVGVEQVISRAKLGGGVVAQWSSESRVERISSSGD